MMEREESDVYALERGDPCTRWNIYRVSQWATLYAPACVISRREEVTFELVRRALGEKKAAELEESESGGMTLRLA